jgi:hypothetical protein
MRPSRVFEADPGTRERKLNLEIWRFGDLEIWRSGDLEIWRSGDLRI